jgi:CDP-glucose 4,6-dehydratase
MADSGSDWSGRKVLVTGATGLVGAWLVARLLERRANVVALVLDADPQSELMRSGNVRRISVVNGPLEDLDALERAIAIHAVDTVFHLGAQAIVGAAMAAPWITLEANVRGTYNLLEACRRQAGLVRCIVVASSDKAYGSSETLPYREDHPLVGTHPYDVSKSCADLLARAYHVSYGLPLAIARCGNIFGGGDLNWSRVVPGTIRSWSRGEAPIIRSDGTFVRDYFYVRDAADAYLALAEGIAHPEVTGQAFNFSLEQPMSVLEMVEAVRQAMGCDGPEPEIQNTARGEIRAQYLDASRARSVLGWSPGYTLEQGLEETVDWYRRYLAD